MLRHSNSTMSFWAAGTVGLLSVFLPCGWLYGFAVVTAATQTLWGGVWVMTVFWLGTLPALSFAPIALRRLLLPLQQRWPHSTTAVWILAGCLAMSHRWMMGF